jgi:hypothetical protein
MEDWVDMVLEVGVYRGKVAGFEIATLDDCRYPM